MIRVIIISLWLCLLSLGAVYFSINYNSQNSHKKTIMGMATGKQLDYVRSRAITIPVIVNNHLQGYVIAQVIYVIDNYKKAQSNGADIDSILNDILVSKFYGKFSCEADVSKVDLTILKKELIQEIDKNLGKNFIKGLIIAHFNYYDAGKVAKTLTTS